MYCDICECDPCDCEDYYGGNYGAEKTKYLHWIQSGKQKDRYSNPKINEAFGDGEGPGNRNGDPIGKYRQTIGDRNTYQKARYDTIGNRNGLNQYETKTDPKADTNNRKRTAIGRICL